MERNSFIFFFTWAEVLSDCTKEVRLDVYDAVIEYAKSGTLPDLKPMSMMAFNFIKKEIDRNNERYDEIIEKRKEAGRKGAEATNRQKSAKTASAEFAENEFGKIRQKSAKVALNVDVDVDVDDSLSMREYTPSQTERENFLRILLFEKCLIKPAEELDRFLAHYSKTGWVDKNGNKIVSKDAALKAWNTQEAAAFEKTMVFRWYQFFKRVVENCDKSTKIDTMPFLTDFRGLQQENDKLIIYCSESLQNQIETALNAKIIAELNELGIKKLNYKFKN
jgi:cell fate (sporulation/competence/biofilm development) regulator YmcA (YheA/YmcA/DUF963 family)